MSTINRLSSSNVRISAFHASLALALVASSGALAAPTWLGGSAKVPDYYQHQLSNQGRAASPSPLPVPPDAVPGAANYAQDKFWWEGYTDSTGARKGGGWCGTTAWLDAIGYWDKSGYKGLVDRSDKGGVHAGKNWVEQMTYSNSELSLTVDATDGGCAWSSQALTYIKNNTKTARTPAGIDADLEQYMWKNGRVEKIRPGQREFNDLLDPPQAINSDHAAQYSSMWSVLTDSVSRGYVAMIRIGDSSNANNNGNWWSNFHVMTMAGYDGALGAGAKGYFADPDNSFRSGVTAAGWGVPYAATDPFPTGLNFYNELKIKADGRTIDGGAYDLSKIDQVWLLRVPTPGSLALLLTSSLLFAARRRV